MKISEFKHHLVNHPESELTFILPDGGRVPAHMHITEVGRVDKTFVDCGGTLRKSSVCSLQAWVADDTEHRLAPGKLARVMEKAAELFAGEDLEVEVEYEDGYISQFPVEDAGGDESRVIFKLGTKHTDCLAKEQCMPAPAPAAAAGCCEAGSGCC